MKNNTTLSNNQIYARLYQEILNIGLEPSPHFFGMKCCFATFSPECRNIYSPKRCIEILRFIKEKGYLPIQYKMWLTND